MNILIISDFSAPFRGGYINSLYALSYEIRSKGYTISYIFPEIKNYTEELMLIGSVYYIPQFKGKRFSFTLVKKLKKIVQNKKIDIVHTHFGLSGFFAATILSKKLSFLHVSHQRNISKNLDEKALFKKGIVKMLYKLISPISCNYYICISSEVKRSLIDYNGINEADTFIIPNAINIPQNNILTKNEEIILNQLKRVAKGRKIVAMTSHMGPQKDHFTVIKSASILVKKYKNILFLFIGDNQSSDLDYMSKIKQEIKILNLDDYFYFTGNVSNVYSFIELAEIGLLITNWEGFGNSIVEYMINSKPVIASNIGGIKDIINNKVNGFLLYKNKPNDLSELISYIFENRDEVLAIAENGKKDAIHRYSIDNWVDKIMNLYLKLYDRKYCT